MTKSLNRDLSFLGRRCGYIAVPIEYSQYRLMSKEVDSKEIKKMMILYGQV